MCVALSLLHLCCDCVGGDECSVVCVVFVGVLCHSQMKWWPYLVFREDHIFVAYGDVYAPFGFFWAPH